MRVDLIDHMGTDLDVVNAARVSFDKQSEYHQDPINDVWYLDHSDQKLITYLAKHKHWSPFSHCFAKFRIKAPIFVARQLQKHVIGLAWNEVSRRYVDSEPEFYEPLVWRKRAENVKQGSSCQPVDNHFSDEIAKSIFNVPCKHGDENQPFTNLGMLDLLFKEQTRTFYNALLKHGVAPEQARMVLPQSTYTEWIWSGSLYAFARVCKQRLDHHAQRETAQIADDIAEHMTTLFPVSWEALMENP